MTNIEMSDVLPNVVIKKHKSNPQKGLNETNASY